MPSNRSNQLELGVRVLADSPRGTRPMGGAVGTTVGTSGGLQGVGQREGVGWGPGGKHVVGDLRSPAARLR